MLYRTYMTAKILEAMLEDRLHDSETTVFSTPYYNCRETGFFFSRGGYRPYNAFVYVCEARNSDQIMVTTSANMGWDYVTDEEYEAARYFEHDQREEALEHILSELLVLDPRI